MSIGVLSVIALAVVVGVVAGAGLAVGLVLHLVRPRVEPPEPVGVADVDPVWPSVELDQCEESAGSAGRHRLVEPETDLLEVLDPDPVRPYMRHHLRHQLGGGLR